MRLKPNIVSGFIYHLLVTYKKYNNKEYPVFVIAALIIKIHFNQHQNCSLHLLIAHP